jgi:hypothetical protein
LKEPSGSAEWLTTSIMTIGSHGKDRGTASVCRRLLRRRLDLWLERRGIRDGFADVLRGLHIREEVEDFIEIRALTPVLRIRA